MMRACNKRTLIFDLTTKLGQLCKGRNSKRIFFMYSFHLWNGGTIAASMFDFIQIFPINWCFHSCIRFMYCMRGGTNARRSERAKEYVLRFLLNSEKREENKSVEETKPCQWI